MVMVFPGTSCSFTRTVLGSDVLFRNQISWIKPVSMHLPQDSPLLLVLRMFELCCEYRNFSEAKVNLVDFQKTLLTVRKQKCASSSPETITDSFPY